MILAGDVGGTKVHLALYSFEAGKLKPVRDQKFPAQSSRRWTRWCMRFLGATAIIGGDDRAEIVAACFGCPGPVRDGRLKLTNLPWTLDARDLQKSLGIEHIFLINDLEANGYGIPELAPEAILYAACRAIRRRWATAAWFRRERGWGEALLIWDGSSGIMPLPSEGGHCGLRGAERPRDRAAELPAADAERARELGAGGFGALGSRMCMLFCATPRRWKSRIGCGSGWRRKIRTR